jgi:CRP-like cAMP-binding protein
MLYSEISDKQVASIHHAVLRLLSDSACCQFHSALLTDAASFFRTSYIDQMLGVRKEREMLQTRTKVEVNAAQAIVKWNEQMMQRQLKLVRKVLMRGAERNLQTLKQNILHAWKRETKAFLQSRRRKEHMRETMLRVLLRRGEQSRIAGFFVQWKKNSSKHSYERRLADNQKKYKENIASTILEMQGHVDVANEENKNSQQRVHELEGLVEVLMRSATQACNKLESCMSLLGNVMSADKADTVDTVDTVDTIDTPRSVLKREVTDLSIRLNAARKKVFDSGDFDVRKVSALEQRPIEIETQTECSLFNSQAEEQQTDITLYQFEQMENLIKEGQIAAAVTAGEEKIMIDSSNDPMVVVKMSNSCATNATQTRLTSEMVGKAFNNLSKLQKEHEYVQGQHAHMKKQLVLLGHKVDTQPTTTPTPIPTPTPTPTLAILPPVIKPVVMDAETLKKFHMLQIFFEHVDLHCGEDFTKTNLEDLVHLLDIHDVHSGDVIISQGEEATWFGMILNGKFDIAINGVGTVANVGNGTVLGELSFLGGDMERTASVKTTSHGIIAAIPYKRILTLQETNSELFTKLMLLIAEGGIQKLFGGQKRLKNTIERLKKQVQEQQKQQQEEEKQEEAEEIFDTTNEKEEKAFQQLQEQKSISDTESDIGSEHGLDVESHEHKKGKKRSHKRKSSMSHHNGKKRGKRGAKFKASSSSEIFYRTKVAKAQHDLEDLQHEMEREEREMNRLRAKIKGEQVMRQQAEKEMEFMRMRLAAAGV